MEEVKLAKADSTVLTLTHGHFVGFFDKSGPNELTNTISSCP